MVDSYADIEIISFILLCTLVFWVVLGGLVMGGLCEIIDVT